MTKKDKSEIIKNSRLNKELDISTICSTLLIQENIYKQYEDGTLNIPKEHLEMIANYLRIDPYALDLTMQKKRKPIQDFKSLFIYDSDVNSEVIPKNKSFFTMIFSAIKKNEKNSGLSILEAELFHPETLEIIRPYIFIRVFFYLVLMACVTLLVDDVVTINLILSLIPPFTLLILLLELDRSREIKGIKLLKYFFFGGFLSIALTYIFRGVVGYPSIIFVEDLVTGCVEETAKMIIVLIIFKKIRIKNVFQGILIGFAVGAGFDVFETTQYGINIFYDPSTAFYDMHINILYRGAFAFIGIGHHFWTAILSGTLVALNPYDKVQIKYLKHYVFIISFFMIVLVHSIWNFTSNDEFFFLSPLVIIISLFIFLKFIKTQYTNDYYEHFKIDSNQQFSQED